MLINKFQTILNKDKQKKKLKKFYKQRAYR